MILRQEGFSVHSEKRSARLRISIGRIASGRETSLIRTLRALVSIATLFEHSAGFQAEPLEFKGHLPARLLE